MAKTYRITGMTCGGCARALEAAIRAEAPAAQVTVDVGAARVTVDGADDAQVERAADSAGFTFEGAA
jgi:copper chaperone